MLIFLLAKGNLEPAKSNWQVDFPDLWFGSVNTTSLNQHRVQRSLYSDQTKKYIYKYKSTLQYNKSKGNPFMGIIKMKL